jgi:hypothetical protein
MTLNKIKAIFAAGTFLATVGLATSASAQPNGTCYHYDESESMRCFNCLKEVQTRDGWRVVNTCQAGYSSSSASVSELITQ